MPKKRLKILDGNVLKFLLSFLDENKIEKLKAYSNLVIEYNKHTNITGAKDSESFFNDHIIDVLLAYKYFNASKKVLDIGSGAGIPAIPLAIVYDSIGFTLCDSKSRKTIFLTEAKNVLELKNIKIYTKNVYEIRDKYDTVTAKAFSDMKTLIKIFDIVKEKNAKLIAYKGKIDKIEQELISIPKKKYSVSINKIEDLLNNKKERHLVIVK